MNMLMITSFICIIIPPILMTLASMIYTRSSSDREKSSPFECGFDPLNSARIPFSTRFFMLAVIFIVFDIEIVLLMPIPLLLNSTSSTTIMSMSTLFLVILILGLIHEWMEGSLNWSN